MKKMVIEEEKLSSSGWEVKEGRNQIDLENLVRKVPAKTKARKGQKLIKLKSESFEVLMDAKLVGKNIYIEKKGGVVIIKEEEAKWVNPRTLRILQDDLFVDILIVERKDGKWNPIWSNMEIEGKNWCTNRNYFHIGHGYLHRINLNTIMED